uniref:Uncharacterized protein n=1 Tax=Anopheles coluzzii TaxID=1518534 RepID=A0A6E8VNU4_ANOCL
MLRKLLRRIFCPCSRKPSKESEEHETPEKATVQVLVVGTSTVDGKKRPVSRNIDIPAPRWSIVGSHTEREMKMLTSRTLHEIETKAVTRKNKSRRRAYEPGDVGGMRMVQVQPPQSNKNATNNASTTITPKDDHHTWDDHSANDNVGLDKLEGIP